MKLFELLIDEDDDLSGVQFLSIVKSPANSVSFEVFSEEKPHTCYVEQDFSDEMLSVLDNYGVELNPDALFGAKISPAVIELTPHDFAPAINPNPREFDPLSGDQEGGNVITRYIYGIDTGMGAPLIRTSREWCKKMIAAQRVFSRQDLVNLSNSLTADGDTFKLIPRAKMNADVDFFQYKGSKEEFGALCRHRWFQIEFAVGENESVEEVLARIPLKAQAALGTGNNVGGAGRPFEAEAKIVPPSQLNRRPAGFSASDTMSPINFHMGLFVYGSKKAALMAEPSCTTMTKIKIKMCDWGYGCEGWVPIEVLPEYFEDTAEVMTTFKVRQNFAKVPEYIREVAQRAVDYAEENGWGDCGTDIGKRRAHDLADPSYNASTDILTRMYSYGSRHKKDWESSDGFDDGCGDLMMAAWGLSRSNYDEAMSWLEKQIDKSTQEMVAFTSDEYKGDITAVVFQPDQKIFRYDQATQTPYYVFMSRDTIRKMLMKISRLKPKNLINFEHTDKIFSGDEVYSYENWLVGDDPKMDKSYEIFGQEFAPGTWVTTIHFKNRELFDNFILSNKTSGISLEGLFEEVPFNFMDIKEKFVEPNAGESQDDFISRCVPVLIGEGKTQDQALGACYGMWDNQFSKEKMDFPDGTCWEGYEPYGTKIVNGREVPNCVPIKTSKEKFAPYPWDECIADMTERYGANAAPKICGKIRSENMEKSKLDSEDFNAAIKVFLLQEIIKEHTEK